MKLLITGGLGFIGSNFILQILQKNDDISIVNIDAQYHGSNSANLNKISNFKNYEFVKGNITDSLLMEKLIHDCDAIINFAAESFVDRSIANAKPFLESNINGVFTILECVKEHKKKFLQVSTDEVFGSLETGSASEHSIFNPTSPYASTKACGELLINSYYRTYNCDILITRCTNNYGPRQFPEKLIPKTILLAMNNKKIPVYGNGTNLRDWLYVEDHCDAIFKVLINGKSGESYNISANNEIDNIAIISKILSIMDKSTDLMEFVEDRPGHDFRYSMNSDKIRKNLNWKENTNFDDGIKQTIDWYLSNKAWWQGLSETLFEHTPWKN